MNRDFVKGLFLLSGMLCHYYNNRCGVGTAALRGRRAMKRGAAFGDFFKRKRMELRLTLREFCRKNGFDAGNISKIERGLTRAPRSSEIKAKYAAALGIKEGTDNWLTFFDLAAADLGQLPEDLKGDERLLKSLPLLFRTVRGDEVSEEDLKRLIEAMRKDQGG
jgi:transcriptional regulator with XRE-family HTH domain